MISLPNGCYCSEISVFPKNWNKAGASLKVTWYLQYRFYDPTRKDAKGKIKPYQKIIKGKINFYKTLPERRGAINDLLNDEMVLLKEEGYNPFTNTLVAPIELEYEINPNTKFCDALIQASKKLSIQPTTLSDINSVIKGVKASAVQMRLADLPIKDVRRKHMKAVLEHIKKINPNFSGSRFNKYRSYLIMLFKELIELEATDVDPISTISKQKTIQNLRDTLTNDQRLKIDKHLKLNNYSFWRFTHIFFHSGARETELINVQANQVDILRQRYRVLLKKGKQYKWVEKTIKDSALPLWEELIDLSKPDDYIFSKGLVPGERKIRPDQITRRWRTWVKIPLSITADFYSLKHLNTTETVTELSAADAAMMNDHTSTAMVVSIYDVNRVERTKEKDAQHHSRLKQVKNKFA